MLAVPLNELEISMLLLSPKKRLSVTEDSEPLSCELITQPEFEPLVWLPLTTATPLSVASTSTSLSLPFVVFPLKDASPLSDASTSRTLSLPVTSLFVADA